MPEFVRVKDNVTKHESTVTREFAEGYKDNLTVLDKKDALDVNGRPLPSKPHAELEKADAGSTAKTGGSNR